MDNNGLFFVIINIIHGNMPFAGYIYAIHDLEPGLILIDAGILEPRRRLNQLKKALKRQRCGCDYDLIWIELLDKGQFDSREELDLHKRNFITANIIRDGEQS